MSARLSTLSNGIRVITDHVEGIDSAAIGVWVGVGTRHEDMSHNGAAHMVEHMLFKGTKTRSAQDITVQIENVGGSMNAYTGREMTSYNVHLLKEDLPLALEIISDMVMNSTLPQDEIERERDVILQEIGMCADTPDDIIFDHYYEAAYPGQCVGAPILGTSDIIKNITRGELQNYIDTHYGCDNMVIAATGGIDHDETVRLCEKFFGGLKTRTSITPAPANYQGGAALFEKELEQSHVILGFEGIARTDEDFYTAQALSTVLGGGMSSRLFQEVREKRGLVYSVFSFHSGLQDSAQFGIYAGTAPERVGELMPVLCDEIRKISNEVLNSEELPRTKAQIKANLLMGRESMMSRADQLAKHLIFRNSVVDIQALSAQIDAITPSDIKRVAGRIFTKPPTLVGVGPMAQMPKMDQIKEKLAA